MRPLRLVVDGLTCFREPQTIDFSGLGVVAIAGPTGAGKSSLLDAMILALYGLVPRMGKTGVGELVAHGRSQLSVQLDFKVGDARYRVARTVSRGNRPSKALLSELVGETEVKKASGVDEVKKATQKILGIDATAFTQAVILPQGEFQQFLKSEPAARRRTLNTLLGLGVYDAMRSRADTIAKRLRHEIDGLQARLAGEWSEVTPFALTAIEHDLAALATRRPEAEREAASAEQALTRVREEAALTAELMALDGRLAALEEPAEVERIDALEMRKNLSLRVAPILPRLDAAEAARAEATRNATLLARREAEQKRAEAEAAQARTRFDEATRAAGPVAELRAQIVALDQARGAFERRDAILSTRGRVAATVTVTFSPDALARALALVPTQAALERARSSRAKENDAQQKEQRLATQRRTAEAGAESSRRDAEVAEAHAGTALRAAEIEHRAAALRLGLVHGEHCPVCAQVVDTVPPPIAAPGLETASQAFATAQTRANAARNAALAARAKADEAERNVERAGERVAQLDDEIGTLEATLVAALPSAITDGLPEARLGTWRGALEAAELEALDQQVARFGAVAPATQRKQLDDQASALEASLRTSEVALTRAEHAHAQALSAHAAALEASERANVNSEALARVVDEALAVLGFGPETARTLALSPDAAEALDAEVRSHRESLLAGRERRLTIRERLGAARASPADVAQAEANHDAARRTLAGLVGDEARLSERARLLRPQLALAEAARARVKTAQLDFEVHARLAEELKSDRFQAYVLEEALADLVRGASARLMALSGDRYGLEVDERSGFLVVDCDNAGEKRSTDTLSGGETFLASLALALELSEQIQIKAGKIHLESLFIDEGFGTLDPETLDVVASAIESLGTSGRMVGLITHVPELSARMPHKILVTRGAAGVGSTVQVDAGT